MAQQYNNTIYEKKHHYMLVLKELTILKNQIDDEVLNTGLKKTYSIDIQSLYVRTIIGLIEEGVEYQYIKDDTDAKKDIIRLEIDGIKYECKNIEIREVLEDRYDSVMNLQYEGPSFKQITDIRKNNEDKHNSEVKELLVGLKDVISETNTKSKEIVQPKFDTELPKITLSIDDNKLLKKDSFGKRFRDTIIHFTISIAILLLIILICTKVPKVNNAIKTGWKNLTSMFGNVNIQVTSQPTTQNATEISTEEIINNDDNSSQLNVE